MAYVPFLVCLGHIWPESGQRPHLYDEPIPLEPETGDLSKSQHQAGRMPDAKAVFTQESAQRGAHTVTVCWS